MKRLSILACLLLGLMTSVKAQHPVNSFFDDLGTTRIQTVEYSETADTIITTFHRMDDILWSKIVYRVIDLRYKQNYQLYFPLKDNDPDYKNLLLVILKAIEDGMPVYDMTYRGSDMKPNYKEPMNGGSLERLFRDESIQLDETDDSYETSLLNSQALQYDTATHKYTFNKNPFESISKNLIKYVIQEVIFFDRHTSRLHTTITAIAPLRADLIQTQLDEEDTPKQRCEKMMSAFYESFTCWIPFLKLRPYLSMQYTIPIQNETRRVTFDEFFQKHMYSSYLLGEDNMYSRMILEYCSTPEEVKKEQERIEKEMLDFEQDLWAY